MKILLSAIFLTALFAPAEIIIAQNAKPVQPSFSLTISTAASTVKVGSEVMLKIELANISPNDIYYNLISTGSERDVEGGFHLNVCDSEGKPVRETPYGMKVHGTDPNKVPFAGSVANMRMPIKPGKTFDSERILSKEYDLNNPGKYTIQAQRKDPSNNIIVKSNTITITVVP